MQMRLIVSAFSFLFNCCVDTRMSLVMSTSPTSYTFGICQLPYMADRQFRTKCSTQYSLSNSYGFVCDTPKQLTLTDVRNFQKILNGRFAYCTCRYGAPSNSTQCYNRTVTYDDGHVNAVPTTVTSALPTGDVLTLSVVYVNFLEKIVVIGGAGSGEMKRSKYQWKPNCDTQNKLFPSSVLYDYSLSEDQYKKEFLDFHRRMLKSRLKTNTCSTDIIIFAFDDTNNVRLPIMDESNLTQIMEDLKRTIQIETSEKAKQAYGDQLTKAVDKINEDYADLSTVEKIKRFLEQLNTMQLKSDADRTSGVPRWAIITFAVCICVSVLAAFVGSFVTDDSSRKRKSSAITGKISRKWRAGFSGGMWASV